MKFKRYLFTIIIFTGIIFQIQAQTSSPVISFDKIVHDFGEFNEENGPVTCEFNFSNDGGSPVIITQVTTSCGCTASEWTREPVLPGKKGSVKATYNPLHRPGVFSKTVNVRTNAETSLVQLTIKGKVIPRKKTIEDEFRMDFGPLRLRSNHLNMYNVTNTKTVKKNLVSYNDSDKNLKIGFTRVPDHIKISTQPEILAPKQKGVINVEYNGRLKKEYGFSIDRIYLVLNGETYTEKTMAVSATLREDFRGLTAEERANAPSIELDTTVFDFKKIKHGETSSFDFIFRNMGKNPLIIRRLVASCGCTVVTPEKTRIESGTSSKITVKFDSRGKSGRQYYNITLITNDPRNPTTNLKVIGEVIKE